MFKVAVFCQHQDGPSPSNLNVARKLVDSSSGEIDGRARVTIDPDKTPANLTYKGDLIARKVQEDFYKKVDTALKKLDMKGEYILYFFIIEPRHVISNIVAF